jgi:hypothetical protein
MVCKMVGPVWSVLQAHCNSSRLNDLDFKRSVFGVERQLECQSRTCCRIMLMAAVGHTAELLKGVG